MKKLDKRSMIVKTIQKSKCYPFAFLFIVGMLMFTNQVFGSPKIKIPLMSKAPVIDGNFSSNEWKDSACASGFISTAKEWPLQQTSAYIAIDERYVYFAFKCESIAVDKILTAKREKDSIEIFNDESVELFLAPEIDGNTYYHLAFNTAGSSYTARCGERRDIKWEPELKLATKYLSNSWVLEGRFPLASMGAKINMGTKLKINFCRNSNIFIKRQYSSWTGQDLFNDKEQMGLGEIAKSVSVDYSLKSLGFAYGIQGELRNHYPKDLKSEIISKYWDKEHSILFDLSSMANKKFSVELPFAAKRTNITLTISGADFEYTKSAFLPFYKKFSIIPERYNFPRSVGKVNVKVEHLMKNAAFIKVSLHASEQKSSLSQMEISADKTDFSIDLKGFTCGRYILSAKLFDKNRKKIAEDDRVIFIKKEIPLPTLSKKQNVRIEKSLFMVNDKLFFPFLMSSGKYAEPPNIPACFNINNGTVGVKENALIYGQCGRLTKMLKDPNNLYVLPDNQTLKEKIRTHIIKSSDKPSFYRRIQYEAQIPLFREINDRREPLNGPVEFQKIGKYVKEFAPGTLTSIQIDRLEYVKDFSIAADIIEVASYKSSYAIDPVKKLSQDIQFTRKQIGHKPLVWWIGVAIPTAEDRSAEKIKGASYLAMMNHVNGIIYHNGHDCVPSSRTRLWSVFAELSRELEFLYPIMTFGKTVTNKNIQVQSPDLEMIVKEYEGVLYLIAVNISPLTVHSEFVFPSSLKTNGIQVLFENRKIKLKNGRMKDNFTAYEPHIYKINQITK